MQLQQQPSFYDSAQVFSVGASKVSSLDLSEYRWFHLINNLQQNLWILE